MILFLRLFVGYLGGWGRILASVNKSADPIRGGAVTLGLRWQGKPYAYRSGHNFRRNRAHAPRTAVPSKAMDAGSGTVVSFVVV